MKLRHIFTICCFIFGLLCPASAKQLSSEEIVFASKREGEFRLRHSRNRLTQFTVCAIFQTDY